MIELPPQFWHGIDLFNQREFFECHEVLEDVWRDQSEPERTLTQGIIQVAVGLYHAGRDNFTGAEKLLLRGFARLDQSRTLKTGLDVNAACDHAQRALGRVKLKQQPELFHLSRLL